MILKEINVDTRQTNLLSIQCDCGHKIMWPLSVQLVECTECGRKELWNNYSKDKSDNKVMKSKIKLSKIKL